MIPVPAVSRHRPTGRVPFVRTCFVPTARRVPFVPGVTHFMPCFVPRVRFVFGAGFVRCVLSVLVHCSSRSVVHGLTMPDYTP